MTWTYDVSDLATSLKDQVRFVVGDTLSTDPQIQDEEISLVLTQRSSIYGAAADCCRALASKYARSADQKAGDVAVKYSDISKAYALRAVALDAQATASGAGVVPFAGGVTDALNDAQLGSPQFNIGMMDSTLPVPSLGNETSAEVLPETQQR
jgi:hypothetical protein